MGSNLEEYEYHYTGPYLGEKRKAVVPPIIGGNVMIVDMLQFAIEALTYFVVNKAERGNTLVVLPLSLGACWLYDVRLNFRRRQWLQLSPAEQRKRQRDAYVCGKRNEPYPL